MVFIKEVRNQVFVEDLFFWYNNKSNLEPELIV